MPASVTSDRKSKRLNSTLLAHPPLFRSVSRSIAQARCPGQNALNAGRIGRDNANGGERYAGLGYVSIHFVEPFVGDLASSRAHIGEDHWWPIGELVDKRVKPGRCPDIDLGHLTTKEVS